MLDQGRSQCRCSQRHESFRGDRFSSGHDLSCFSIYVRKICEIRRSAFRQELRLMLGSSRAAFVF
jgi:hypothetical protein